MKFSFPMYTHGGKRTERRVCREQRVARAPGCAAITAVQSRMCSSPEKDPLWPLASPRFLLPRGSHLPAWFSFHGRASV